MSDQAGFDLELRLDGLPSDDALRIQVSAELTAMSVGDMLVELFGTEESPALTASELRDNPDLPDIHAQFVDLFDRWRDGTSTLRFYARDGAEIDPDELVSEVLSSGGLSLAVRQTFEVLDWFASHGGDPAELLGWLRRSSLLYAVDKHEFQVLEGSDGPLLSVALELQAEGLVAPNEASTFEITEAGREHLGAEIAETESYIDQYDIFSDVLYDLETQSARFGTGNGEDLRAQVYESEGIDPIRAVFLLRLYDGSLDGHPGDWTEKVMSEEILEELLAPVLDHPALAESDLEWLVEAGFAEQEERSEEARRLAARRQAMKKSGTAQPPA